MIVFCLFLDICAETKTQRSKNKQYAVQKFVNVYLFNLVGIGPLKHLHFATVNKPYQLQI